MNESIKQAVMASQSAIMTTLGQSATKQHCLAVVKLLAHTLLTEAGKHNKKISFHNLDFFHHELEAMIKLEKRSHEPH
ncbi:MAG: hypothetical protein ACR65R_01415 [Methylomicrobium sp.]